MTEQTQKITTLPNEYLECTLDQLHVGEYAWTVPWAMNVDEERHCSLSGSFTAHSNPGGTVEMRVEHREDGYHVWLPRKHKYKPSDSDFDGRIPVVELHQEWGT